LGKDEVLFANSKAQWTDMIKIIEIIRLELKE
jgi:hypothetical protein